MQRRRERRYEVWESVVMSILDTHDECHRPATIVDVSKSGYRVLFGSALAPGTKVLTILHSVAIFGVVRHCEEAPPDAFTIGMEITKVVAASEPSSGRPTSIRQPTNGIAASCAAAIPHVSLSR